MVPPGGCVVAPGGWGGMHGCSGKGHAWLLPGGVHCCSRGSCMVAPGGVRGCSGGCMVAHRGHVWLLQGGMHGCSGGGHAWLLGGHVWDMTRYGDTINERAVRILLECILVITPSLCIFMRYGHFFTVASTAFVHDKLDRAMHR